MPPTLPAGPFKTVETGVGQAPWYIIPFDKRGACTGPLTRKHLVEAVGKREFTDVFLFSHGWNNDWEAASQRYEGFISGFIRMRAEHDLPFSPEYRPVLAGIFWPSTALVMPWERPPKFAAAGASSVDSDVAGWMQEVDELAADVDPGLREEFYGLAQTKRLSDAQVKRLAVILADVIAGYATADLEAAGTTTNSPTAQELVDRSKQLAKGTGSARRKPGEFGFADDSTTGPQAALSLGDLDPRGIIRIATVLQMKDRAGVVGRDGVGPLLRDVLKADKDVRVHLVGHSYGAIVVLSALCNIPEAALPAKVDSILLLQPAVSQWCFASNVDNEGYPGGYRSALKRVRQPIMTTFSKNDVPLTKMFHLAARRDSDKGQLKMAAGANLPAPPSSFAALGGFGPAGLSQAELQVLDMTVPMTRYSIREPEPRVIALRGDRTVPGHGDISVPATWWALFQQVDGAAALA